MIRYITNKIKCLFTKSNRDLSIVSIIELKSHLDLRIVELETKIDQLKSIIADTHYLNDIKEKRTLSDYELKVFSQWGEDGIIQFLVDRINPECKLFVEIGVEDYKECNTRYLLIRDNWKGFAIDADEKRLGKIYQDEIIWKYDIQPIVSYVTKDNIDNLLKSYKIAGKIGLLSIDIDGNDYWIWQAIRSANPDIVVCEYQSMWGFEHPVTIPYTEEFNRAEKKHHNIYYSCSLPALIHLATEKGYAYIGSNKVGSNAFFINEKYLNLFEDIDKRISYASPGVREYRNSEGQLTYQKGVDMLSEIADLPLYHVGLKSEYLIRDLYKINNGL
jgi:hypothetical protein